MTSTVAATLILALTLNALADHKQEEAQRRKDMAEYRAYLEQRLKTVPPPAVMKKLKARLKEVGENRSMTGDKNLPILLSDKSISKDPMISEACFNGLVALKEALATQGTDLILIPVPHPDMVYAQRLLKEIPNDADLNPNRTRSLIKLIDAGVEVLDLREPFSNYEGTRFAMEFADHHWSSQGMALAAKLLYERIKRYEVVRRHRAGQKDWEIETVNIPTPIGSMRWAGIFTQHPIHRKDTDLFQEPEPAKKHVGIPSTEPVKCFTYKGTYDKAGIQGSVPIGKRGRMPGSSLSPAVVLLGDSMLNHLNALREAKGKTGSFQRHVGYEVGVPVSWLMHIANAHRVGGEYIVLTATMPTRPRVAVLVGFTGTTMHEHSFPVPDPALAKAAGEDVDPRNFIKERATVFLSQVPTIPDPAKTTYKDATVAAVAVIKDNNSLFNGKKVKVQTWAFRDRTLAPGIEKWKNKKKLKLDLMPWSEAQEKYPKLDEYQTLDEVEDLLMPRVWAEIVQ